jgi:choline-sulfatase
MPHPSITRRQFVAAATAAAPRVARARDRQPNLLFLLSDDHAGYVLGADGNPQARTPNLDRLAAEGTRFAANYCNSPVCSPSRQSIFTGQLPHAAGVTVLQTPLDLAKPTLAKQLRASGFTTAVIGKMHFNRPGAPGIYGFDHVLTEDLVHKQWLAEVGPPPDFGALRTKPQWRPFRDPARIWLNAEKLPFPRHEEQMKSAWQVRQASRYLEEHKRDRFALWLSFQEPHSPYDFPIEWTGRFNPAAFPVPRVGPEDPPQIPQIFRDLTPAEKQGIIASYYTSVNYLDHNIGRILDKLRQLDLERDTLVVYIADHGYSLGHHGRVEKHSSYEQSLRVPLILRLPGRIRSGHVVRDFTESVDLPPTLLELLGAEPFALQHGHSLVPYLEGRRPARPRQSIFSEYLWGDQASVRTARWKYAHSTGARVRDDGYKESDTPLGRSIRLWDQQNDPGEFTNLASKHPEVVRELQQHMLSRFRATHPEAAHEPPRLTPEDAIEWYLRPRDRIL